MRTLRIAAIVAILLPTYGCIPLQSFHPLWDEQHVSYDSRLVGEWIAADPDDDGVLRIAELDGNAYLVTHTELEQNGEVEESRFQAHLVRLGEHLFLDFIGHEPSLDERLKGESYQSMLLTHFFARIDLDSNTLRISVLDDERFDKKMSREAVDIPLVKRGDTILLIAPTEKIQEVLQRFAEDPDLWGDDDDELTFTRVTKNDAH